MRHSFTTLLAFLAAAAQYAACGEELHITAPTTLPRNHPLDGYSPLVRIRYSGIQPQEYTLKVWLLETGNYHLGSTQWEPIVTRIAGGNGADRPDGEVLLHPNMDVHDYQNFLWVARLFNSAGVEVGSDKSAATGVDVAPALLEPITAPAASVGKAVHLQLNAASSGQKAAIEYRIHNPPAGSSLNASTGVFTWTPTEAGTYRLVFEAVATGTKVADAEVVTVNVAAAGKGFAKE